ncbi:MAG TPA: CDP-alcohol phosphatidyltransferase family protein [Bacillota bacterium]|nr:CDP-alcohol phosphatidyltransferase family protein [Bacillota bacterium]
MNKKQIPNMLSILRLLMIPAFIAVYFSEYKFVSLLVYTLAWITDVVDGYLARRHNWITDLGKILDPLADKLMQLAAVTCLIIDDKLPLFVVVVLVIKELLMLAGSIFILRSKRVVVVSDWFGKMSTATMFAAVILLIFIDTPPAWLETVLSILMVAVLLFALMMYAFKAFVRDDSTKKKKSKKQITQ